MLVDGVDPVRAMTAPSAIPRDVQHSVNVEAFQSQMEIFDRMRRTEAEFRAAREAAALSGGIPGGEKARATGLRAFESRGLDNLPASDHPHAELLARAQHVLLGLELARRKGTVPY